MQSTAYDTALESLLTASAALDSLDLDRGSHLVLKIASLVIEAKKADKKKKDEKKKPSLKKKDDKSDKKKVSKSATEFLSYEKTATNILTYKTAQITPNTYSYWSPKSLADNAKSGNINLDDLHRSGKITNEQYDQAYQLVNGVAAPGAKQPKKIEYTNTSNTLNGATSVPNGQARENGDKSNLTPAHAPHAAAHRMPVSQDVQKAQIILSQFPKYKALLGTTGPNKNGVDGQLGQHTQAALKQWKTDNGYNQNMTDAMAINILAHSDWMPKQMVPKAPAQNAAKAEADSLLRDPWANK